MSLKTLLFSIDTQVPQWIFLELFGSNGGAQAGSLAILNRACESVGDEVHEVTVPNVWNVVVEVGE